MKKKLIISLSVLIGFLAIVITLCFTIFTVKSVAVDFRTSSTQSWSSEEIIETADFPIGKNIFFLSKSKYEAKLEKAYPYLEVINIETKFPSKLVIHCAEREEMYVIQRDADYLICDDDMKVLKIESGTFISSSNNPILLNGVNILNTEYDVGDFLEIKEAGFKKFYSAMLENNRQRSQMLGLCKEISFEEEHIQLTNKDEINMTIKTFSNREIKILNISTSLNLKLNKMFFALSNIYEVLMENGDFTEDEVDRCSLVLGNQIMDTKEIYCHIYLDGDQITDQNRN